MTGTAGLCGVVWCDTIHVASALINVRLALSAQQSILLEGPRSTLVNTHCSGRREGWGGEGDRGEKSPA